MDPPNQNLNQRLGQTRLEHNPPMDGFVFDCYYSRFYEKTKELPRSLAVPRPDCGGINEGNSEWRWLEQVERVARRLTIPVWQSWGRGQKLIASVEPVYATSQSGATATETELTSACTPFGVNTEGFTLDQDGVAKGPESSTKLKTHGLDHISQVEKSGTDTDELVKHFNMVTDNLGWISAGLERFGSFEDSPGNKRAVAHMAHSRHSFAYPFQHKQQH